MEFLLQDAILYIIVCNDTALFCLLEVFFRTNVSRFVRQQASSGRQRAFALVDYM